MQRAGVTCFAWAMCLWLVACGGPTKSVGRQPSWRTQRLKRSAATSTKNAPTITEYVPKTPGVARYNDPPITPAPRSPLADAIVKSLADTAARSGRSAPRPDGRLYAAAKELAALVPDQGPLAYPLVEFAMQRQGIIEPSPHLVIIWGPIDRPEPVLAQLRGRMPALLASGSFSRVGIGSAKRAGKDQYVTVLALQTSNLRTSPIPRELVRGGVIAIDATVLGAYRRPEVFVTRENGKVEQPTLAHSGATTFRAKVACDGHKGRQQIEVTAVDASGSTVLANFPVWCNERAPTSIVVDPDKEDAKAPTSVGAAERRMFALINKDRQRYGLPVLVLAPGVVAVARAHSEDMRATGAVAHVSPRTGSAADRVRAAGIRTAVVMENVARAYGVGEAQRGLMNSPGHRANLLSKQATHVGVGLALGAVVAGRRELFVTQVFIRVPPRIKRPVAIHAIRTKIAAYRSLARDAELDSVAQQYAIDVAGGLSTKDASKRAAKRAGSLAQRFRRATTVVTAVVSLDSFKPADALTDRSATHYGIGVAQGDHKVLGKGAIYIVLMVAQQRSGAWPASGSARRSTRTPTGASTAAATGRPSALPFLAR